MPALPPDADIDELRRTARSHFEAARAGDPEAAAWLAEDGAGITLAAAHLQLARDHGFPSWAALHLEVARRRVLDRHDADALARFVADHPEAVRDDLTNWSDHPRGASPLGYVAMARYDTTRHRWRDVAWTGAAARALLGAGAPVDGNPGDPETPLITAASYGDADVAAVLIAAGADVDAVAAPDSGGVPGGSAVLHAAVFGMTDVLDVLVAAGARIRSLEEAAASGDVTGWLEGAEPAALVRALTFAADHQRLAVIDALVAAGTPVDAADPVWHRHPLRLAAANGRPLSVTHLLEHGADPRLADGDGLTPLDHCQRGRLDAPDPAGHDAVAAILSAKLHG